MSYSSRRSRLVAIASVSMVAAGCGSSGGSDVGSTTAAGATGGAGGAGGGAAAGGAGTGGGAGGGVAGMGGVAGLGGVSGASGAAGAAGAGGTTSGVPCPPAGTDPVIVCFHGGGPLPTGCGEGMSGGDLACYVPGEGMAPPSPCLEASDPTITKVLSSGCEMVTDVTGTPACRLAAQWNAPAAAVPACCYSAKSQTLCVARPFLVAGRMRKARLGGGGGWG